MHADKRYISVKMLNTKQSKQTNQKQTNKQTNKNKRKKEW